MALPTTITGVVALGRTAGKIGPFISAAGDVYIVFRDSASTANLDVHKATDPTTSFSQVATLVMTGSSQEIFAYAVIQNGDDLWIGTSHRQTSPGAQPIMFHRFSMTSDAFITSNEDTGGGGTTTDASKQVDISFRTAGPVIQYNGPTESVMGAKQRAAYAERTSSVWTADIALDAGGEVNYFTGGVVKGASNKLHFLFKDGANADAQHRSLTSADVLSAVENYNDSAADTPDFIINRPAFYDDGGTERITAGYKTATNLQASEIDNDGVPGAEEAVTDSAPVVSDGQVQMCFSLRGAKQILALYARASDGDLYLDTNDNSGGWGTDSNVFTGAVTFVSCNFYTRAGTPVLAYVINDGGTIKYNEIVAGDADLTGTALGAVESAIVAGGNTVIITLTDATWVTAGATFDAQRQAIIDGMDSAQSELTGWNNEVRDKQLVAGVVRTSDTVVTITLDAQAAYDITAQEFITVTVPASAVTGDPFGGDIEATPIFTVSQVATSVVTGTAVPSSTEAQIVSGGRTIILTLTDDTWVAAGGTFDAIRQDIIDGLDSAQSEVTGWNAEVRDKQTVGGVVRTSATVVTITLDAQAGYNVIDTETITATVPASAVTLGASIVATPTFAVTEVPLATVSGTIVPSVVESTIVAGGQTIILTLVDDEWVADGATFNAVRQDIIDGLNSNQSEVTGWDAEVRDKEVVTAVVRTSPTVVTITLTAQAAYDITINETITVTVPASALDQTALPITGSPTFSIETDAPIPGPEEPDPFESIAGNGLGGISRHHTPPGVIVNY